MLLVISFMVGAVVGGSLGGDFHGKATVPVLIVCAVVAALAPVHWWVGRALNSAKYPEGRSWFDEHTYMGAPMQRGVIVQFVMALMLASFVVGRATSAWIGWGMFAGVLLAAVWAGGRRRRRQRLRGVADRAELARSRGWRYRERDSGLALRWKSSYGRKVYSMDPFGIIGGELDGLPFTVFDTEVTIGRAREMQTVCAVHLPVSYPRFAIRIERTRKQAEPQDLRPESSIPAFGEHLLTPAVRAVTVRYGLLDWHIDGRDLLYRAPERAASRPTEEVLTLVRRLVELANAFPAGLAERYGAPPTQDIPLVKA